MSLKLLQLYWVDSGRRSIEVAELDGQNRKLLIHEELVKPSSLVLHYGQGLMFWSNRKTPPLIEQAHMDGTNRQVPKPYYKQHLCT